MVIQTLADQGLDKLDRIEGRRVGWTDTHVSYINRSMRVARVCVCVCVKEQAAPTVYTVHCIAVNSGERERQIPVQVNLPFLTLKKEAKERCLLDHCDIVSFPI